MPRARAVGRGLGSLGRGAWCLPGGQWCRRESVLAGWVRGGWHSVRGRVRRSRPAGQRRERAWGAWRCRAAVRNHGRPWLLRQCQQALRGARRDRRRVASSNCACRDVVSDGHAAAAASGVARAAEPRWRPRARCAVQCGVDWQGCWAWCVRRAGVGRGERAKNTTHSKTNDRSSASRGKGEKTGRDRRRRAERAT